MQLPAFEIEQNSKKFYFSFMTAEQLADEQRIKADKWTPLNPEGYQRDLDPKRAGQFARFISSQKNFSPSSILLSVRGPLSFHPKSGNYGILEIPDNEILWEVDGQHRIGGLRIALRNNPDMKVTFPVIIISPTLLQESDPRFFEAKQFVVINKTQKRVRADISDRFIMRLSPEQKRELEVLGGEEKLARRQRAVIITDKMDAKEGSPWYKAIKHPGEEGIISAVSFTSSIEPILSDVEFSEMSDDELVEILDAYWSAWQDLCPNAFEKPEEYQIQKTTGAYSLHLLFIEVVKLLRGRGKEYTKENFYELLSIMPDGNNDDFWRSQGTVMRAMGTGKKAFQELARTLYRNILEGLQPMSQT
jgi:DGQHR domain-containing protein